jgi:hypothetical protein
VAAAVLGLQVAVLMQVTGLEHQVRSLERQIGVNSNEVLRLGGRINTLEAVVRDLRGDPGVERQASPILDFDGIDGLTIGGTTADAEDAGLALLQEGDRFDSCVVMTVQSLPGVRAIVVNDTIKVIELAGETKTIAGVGPGSTRAEVTSAHAGQPLQERVNRFAFAEIAVAQSAADDPLTLSYIFDHRAERVTGVRAGHASDVVGYDEGCA